MNKLENESKNEKNNIQIQNQIKMNNTNFNNPFNSSYGNSNLGSSVNTLLIQKNIINPTVTQNKIVNEKISVSNNINPESIKDANTYNINLSNQEVINNDSLLALFNTDYANVSGIIENRFKYYYQDIVNNEYYASDECDYNF